MEEALIHRYKVTKMELKALKAIAFVFMLTGEINIGIVAAANVVSQEFLEAKERLSQAINEYDHTCITDCRSVFERLLEKEKDQCLPHYYIAYADEILFHIITNDVVKQSTYLQDALSHLEECLRLNPFFVEAYILKADIYNISISNDKDKAIDLSELAAESLSKATTLEPSNPRIFLVKGRSEYYTPPGYGGGNTPAKKSLKKSAKLFLTYKPKSPGYPDWGHEEVYAWLGQIAVREDSLGSAEKYYAKALELNPRYSWVRDMLLPRLDKKLYLRLPTVIPGGGYFSPGSRYKVTLSHDDSLIKYTLDGSEPNENSPSYSSQLELTGPVKLKAKAFGKNGKTSKTCTATYIESQPFKPLDTDIRHRGLKYRIFKGSWNRMPEFSSLKSIQDGIAENLALPADQQKDFFAIQWEGLLDVPSDGLYTFYLSSDDGSMLYLDKLLLIDNDGRHGTAYEKSVAVALLKGCHRILINFFEYNGLQALNLYFEGPGVPKQPLGPQFFGN